jgi:MOSC domain-containing protein YiiM
MRTDGLCHGVFAENLTTEGIELHTLPVGTLLQVGDEAVLEITQIGKECHADCAIRRQAGDCVMPREGIFAIVLTEGVARPGDEIRVLP